MGIQSEVQYAVVAAAATGNNTLVAAVAGKKIRVVQAVLVASGGLNSARFESGADGTALTGVMDLVADGQLVLQNNMAGWFETAPGVLLNLELSAATSVAGVIGYVTVE